MEALRPVVPAGGPGRVYPFQRLLAVGGRAFLVQVDRHARNAGLPRQLKQQRRVVERPGRGVDHVAADAAVFGGQRRIVAAGRNRIGERLHAELDERILAEQALPAHRRSPGQRRIDAAAGQKGRRRIGSRRPGRSEVIGTVLDRGARAIRIRAVHGARVAQIHRKRSLLDRIGQAGGDRGVAGAGLARAVDGAAGVIHHVRAGRLVARGIGLDDQPVHEREHLVPAGEAVQVGVVEEAEAAIAIADVGGHQRQAGLERVAAAVHVGNAVAIAVDEGPGEQVRAPLRGREFEAIGRRGTRRIGATSQRAGRPADMDGRHQAVQHDVVPLIEHRQHPVALRDAPEVEVSIGIALGKPEGRTVGLADRHIALREAVVGVVAAAVGALVRRAAHVRVGDAAVHVGRALGRGRRIADPAVRAVVPALVDHLRIRESDRDVESARPELLEVARLVGFDESLVRLAAVQGIGLQPLLASADAVRGRHGLDLIQPRVQVVDDRLTLQRRHRHAIGLEVRAGRDHSDDAVGPGRDRAGVQAGDRIDRPRQRVRQRLVEHVVGRLARVVAEAAGLVEQHDVEAAQARLVRRERVDTAAGIVLAVQRLVVLEDEHGDLSGRQRRALQLDIDGGHVAQTAIGAVGGNLGAGDLRATHRVAAVSNADRKAGTVAHARGLARHVGNDVAGVGVDRSAGREPPLRSVPEADRSALTVQGRVDAVGRHHRQVVVLGRIEVDLARIDRDLLGRVGMAHAVALVAGGGEVRTGLRVEDHLSGLAGHVAHAAGRDHRHVGGVEVVAQTLDRKRGAGAAVRIHRPGGRIDLALRIDLEGAIFLDDPAIVGDGRTVGGVGQNDLQAAALRERQRDGGGRGARGALRVLHAVLEGVGARCGGGRGERAVGRGQVDRQRQAGQIDVVGQHARRADVQPGGHGGGVAVVLGRRCRTQRRASRSVCGCIALGDRRGAGHFSVDDEAEGAAAGRGCRGRRVREGAVRLHRQHGAVDGQCTGQRPRLQRHPVGAPDAGQQTLGRIGHRQGGSGDAVEGRRIRGQRQRRRGAGRTDPRGRTAVDIDIGLHATVALIVGRQAQLAVEHRIGGGGVVSGGDRIASRLDRHVVGLASGQEYFGLPSGRTRQQVAVLGPQGHRGIDDRRHVHAQAGVDKAQQQLAVGGRRGRAGQRPQLGRTGNAGAIERNAVDQVVGRAVVDRRRVAGVVRRRSRIAALAGLSAPDVGLRECFGANRRCDRTVLHRVDFAEQQRQVGVIGQCARRARVGAAGRSADDRSARHDQHAVQAHRPLDRGVRAGLDQVRACPQVAPGQRHRVPCGNLGTERLHPIRLHRGQERRVAGRGRIAARNRARIGSAGSGPGCAERLVHRTGRGRAAAAQTAAHLSDDHERGRHRIAVGEHQLVRQVDRQAAARRDRDDRRDPSAGGGRKAGARGQSTAGAGAGVVAEQAPHGHRLPVGQRRLRGRCGQVDHGLRERRSAGEEENGSRHRRLEQARLESLGSHQSSPRTQFDSSIV